VFAAAMVLILSLAFQWLDVILEFLVTSPKFTDVINSLMHGFVATLSLMILHSLYTVMTVNLDITNALHDDKDKANALNDLSK
tara:strand:- start:1821 stop:2069 length:249 start_codon:yes stop_codon:yes gene_type:complete